MIVEEFLFAAILLRLAARVRPAGEMREPARGKTRYAMSDYPGGVIQRWLIVWEANEL